MTANAELKQGQYIKIMPKLVAAGLELVSPAWVMDARNKNNKLFETPFDTNFGVAADDKTVWLFPHSKHLRAVTAETQLEKYGIPLKNKDDFEGAIPIPRSEFGDYLGKALTSEEFQDSPIRTLVWLPHLAEGDEQRMNAYENNAFTLGMRHFHYNRMLGFYVAETDKPVVKPLEFRGSGCRANADGDGYMHNGNARLVGVRRGSSTEGNTLETRLQGEIK